MSQVHAEVVRRHGGAVGAADAGVARVAVATLRLPRWQPVAPRLSVRSAYRVGDFMRFSDADFVEVAYQTLLGRAADAAGKRGYLEALRSGMLGKVEILGQIRFSEEGRRRGVHVDGLLLPYTLHRWRHIRGFGWLLGMVIAVFRLPRLAWRLQGMEAAAAHETQALGRLLARVEHGIEQHAAEVGRAIAVQDSESRRRVEALDAAFRSRADESSGRIDALAAEAARARAGIGKRLEAQATALAKQATALAKLADQVDGDQRSVRVMLERLAVFLNASAPRRPTGGTDVATMTPALEAQYASFELTFRGAREQIKLRAAHYLETLARAGIAPGDAGIVLDLGCGRGEWLEVLAEHGYHGLGVDSNRSMLEASAPTGIDVVEADALAYLRTQPDGSFAAVSSMHMVEHMPHPVVIELLDEAFRVLRPGGVLILETPNPENVLVGACMFYMDPTHLHPIPPQLLQWTVAARGFEQATIERLSEHRGAPDLEPVPEDVPGAAQINQMVAWFTAPPDYAVIARRPAACAI